MYVYTYNALSARFFAVDRALNFYFMIMIMIYLGAQGVYVIVVQSMPQWPLALPATLKLSKHRGNETRELEPHSSWHCDSSDRHCPL